MHSRRRQRRHQQREAATALHAPFFQHMRVENNIGYVAQCQWHTCADYEGLLALLLISVSTLLTTLGYKDGVAAVFHFLGNPVIALLLGFLVTGPAAAVLTWLWFGSGAAVVVTGQPYEVRALDVVHAQQRGRTHDHRVRPGIRTHHVARCTIGCRVLTRPSQISGKPVTSLMLITSTPLSESSFIVPPVAITSQPRARRPLAKSTTPEIGRAHV